MEPLETLGSAVLIGASIGLGIAVLVVTVTVVITIAKFIADILVS